MARAGKVDQQAAQVTGGMLQSFQAYPAFRMLMLGTLATNSAFWMYQVAVGWLALQMTDSAAFVGLTGFVSGIPMLILSIPGGMLIDRYDRRLVLSLAQWGVMIVASLFALLVAFDALNRWSLLLLAGSYGTVMAFIFPTRTTIVPSLVERRDLVNAVALNSAGQNATRVIGPSMAGILIATIGPSGTFAIAAILQVAALLSTARLPEAASGLTNRISRSRGSILHGVRIVLGDRFLVSTILLAFAANILVMPYLNLMPVFAQDVLDLGSSGLGLLLGSVGLGTVVGALVLARAGARFSSPKAQVISAMSFSVLVILFAMTTHVVPSVVLLFATGLASAAFLALNQTGIQLRVKDEDRGRVMAVYMLTWGMMPVGQLSVGALAGQIGAPLATITACVASFICVVVVVLKFPLLWKGEGP